MTNLTDLTSIDTVKFPSFDEVTDFNLEKGPNAHSLMECITLSTAQDCISLEKLEVMGDSVLKLIVSLHLFRSFPTWDEGKMTLLRMQLISNLHLYQLAQRKRLGEYLSGSVFIPDKHWLPWGFSVPENVEEFIISKGFQRDYDIFKVLPTAGIDTKSLEEIDELVGCQFEIKSHTTYTHSRIGDKSLADSMEAIIGAYYVNGGLDGAFLIMNWLELRGPLEDGSCEAYSRETTLLPFPSTGGKKKGEQMFIAFLEDLEETLQYK